MNSTTTTIKKQVHATIHHCGRDWNLGDVNKSFNPRLWRYKLHFRLRHNSELKGSGKGTSQ